MKNLLLIIVLLCTHLHAASPLDLSKRINAHISIEDYRTAFAEAQEAFQLYPNSKDLVESYIKATAKSGNEKEMLQGWKYYCSLVEKPYENRDLLEVMGWSVIEKGSKSPSPLVRVIAVLGAFFGQDARGVRIIQRSMRDHDSMVRTVALQVAASLRDERIRREVLSLLRTEQVWEVRLSVIRASGKMKIKEALPHLMDLIKGERTMYEIRVAALQAVAEIEENVNREKIQTLANSPRVGYRQLAAQIIAEFEREEDLDVMIPLIRDSQAEVRASALYCIGMLRPKQIDGKSIPSMIEPLLNDNNEKVAITAAWLMTIYDQQRGQRNFPKWLNHSNRETRILAAAALKATGRYGQPLLYNAFVGTDDPYVKMNLALGLIVERSHVEEAAQALNESLTKVNDRLMWCNLFHFKSVSPSNVKRNASIPNLPEATDQLVRLEMFNALAIVKDPHAQESIRIFLEQKNWRITATASSLLLMEGDENAVDLVEALLEDPNPKVRIQSALVLALWGEGNKAAAILKEAYADADRSTKERILEGLGQIKSNDVLPFLSSKLSEQHPTLRIIAAAALLKAMYN